MEVGGDFQVTERGATVARTRTTPAPVDETVAPLSQVQRAALMRTSKAMSAYGDVRKRMTSIAKAIVDLRLTFTKDDGQPDYRGDTAQYRGAVAGVYEKAIPDAEERAAFKVSIRYWIGKEFDSRVEAGTIEAADLTEAGFDRPTRSRGETPDGTPIVPGTHDTGLQTVEGDPVLAEDLLHEVERIVEDPLGELAPMAVLGSIERSLSSVASQLSKGGAVGMPPRAFKRVAQALLEDVLVVADLAGVDIPALVSEYAEEAQATLV